MNLRPRKGKVVAPRAALKNNLALPTPNTSGGSENPKPGKSKRNRNDENKSQGEERSSKRVKREAISDILLLATPASQVAPLQRRSQSPQEELAPVPVSVPAPTPASEPVQKPVADIDALLFPPLSPYRAPSFLEDVPMEPNPYDEGLFSGTESEISELTQHDYDTPVSSRSGTPYPSYVHDLERTTGIMNEISQGDVELVQEIITVEDEIVVQRRRARDIRLLTIAEKGRRERMEAFFRYWQQLEGCWDRRWLYGEKMVPDHWIELEPIDEPLGPPTIPNARAAALAPLAPAARPAVRIPQRLLPVVPVAAAPVKPMANAQAGPSVEKRAGMVFDGLLGWVVDPKYKSKSSACEPSTPPALVGRTDNGVPLMQEREGVVFDNPSDIKGKAKAATGNAEPSAIVASLSVQETEEMEVDELLAPSESKAKAGPSEPSHCTPLPTHHSLPEVSLAGASLDVLPTLVLASEGSEDSQYSL